MVRVRVLGHAGHRQGLARPGDVVAQSSCLASCRVLLLLAAGGLRLPRGHLVGAGCEPLVRLESLALALALTLGLALGLTSALVLGFDVWGWASEFLVGGHGGDKPTTSEAWFSKCGAWFPKCGTQIPKLEAWF